MLEEDVLQVSVIIIGRNEGERLIRCINSVKAMDFDPEQYEIIFCDSGSTDGSMENAEKLGARSLLVESDRPTASKGRNLGYRNARGAYLFFLDGDTIVHPDFLKMSIDYLESHEKTAVIWGHRRETHPEKSVYNRVLDLDWVYPPGEAEFCGGDVVMRKAVLDEVQPYSEDLIAGEEPELCSRIRKAGYTIYHIDAPMTGHDLDIRTFGGYWKRCYRAGHAYAEVAERTNGMIFGRDSRKNHIQTLIYLIVPILLLSFLHLIGLALLTAGAFLIVFRTYLKQRWRGASFGTTFLYAFHSHFAVPIIWLGQLKYYRDRSRGRGGRIIEYK